MSHKSAPEVVWKALLDLGEWQETGSLILWHGFYGRMPEEKDQAIACIGTKGIDEGRNMRTQRLVEKPGVQVLVRAKTYAAAFDKACHLSAVLDGIKNQVVEFEENDYSYKIQNFSRRGTIIPLMEDAKKRQMFSMNGLVTIHEYEVESP